jgi:hypothetical protein
MKIISHRGNIIGPNPTKENSPSYIDTTISIGFDVEVDINYINNKFYLGHDTPDYEITETWMDKRKDNIWFHCKNLGASVRLSQLNKGFKYFCHTSDPFVLTSTNHIWVHDLSLNLGDKTIIPLLNKNDVINYTNKIVYGICTDYVTFASYDLKQKGLYR